MEPYHQDKKSEYWRTEFKKVIKSVNDACTFYSKDLQNKNDYFFLNKKVKIDYKFCGYCGKPVLKLKYKMIRCQCDKFTMENIEQVIEQLLLAVFPTAVSSIIVQYMNPYRTKKIEYSYYVRYYQSTVTKLLSMFMDRKLSVLICEYINPVNETNRIINMENIRSLCIGEYRKDEYAIICLKKLKTFSGVICCVCGNILDINYCTSCDVIRPPPIT